MKGAQDDLLDCANCDICRDLALSEIGGNMEEGFNDYLGTTETLISYIERFVPSKNLETRWSKKSLESRKNFWNYLGVTRSKIKALDLINKGKQSFKGVKVDGLNPSKMNKRQREAFEAKYFDGRPLLIPIAYEFIIRVVEHGNFNPERMLSGKVKGIKGKNPKERALDFLKDLKEQLDADREDEEAKPVRKANKKHSEQARV